MITPIGARPDIAALRGTPRRSRLLAIAALALAVRLLAAWSIPFSRGGGDPNFAPDEYAHFEVVRALAAGDAPVWPRSASVYSVFPPSQYLVQAATFAAARALGLLTHLQRAVPDDPSCAGIVWARLGSALLGAVFVLLLSRSTGRIMQDERDGLLVGALAALYPQHVFVSSCCNADILTLTAGMFLLDALTAWAFRGEGSAGLPRIGLGCGLVTIAKLSGFYLLIPALAWVAIARARKPAATTDAGSLPARPHGASLAVAAAAAVCVAAPFLLWNTLRNGGDPLGLHAYSRYLAEVVHPKTMLQLPRGMLLFAKASLASSYGLFGNMSLPLPAAANIVFASLALFGLAVSLRARPREPLRRRLASCLLGAAALNLAFEFAKCLLVDFQPQGRYLLLPVLGCASAALLAPGRRWPRLRLAWPALFLSVIAASSLEMQWLLYSRGR